MPTDPTVDEGTVKLKINGEVYEIDMDDLELGEVGEVEDLCDKSVQEIDWESARGMQGLVWIALHRKNPRFTVAEAGRVKLSQLENPDESNGNGSKAKTARPTKSA